jgi:hypothetical protein
MIMAQEKGLGHAALFVDQFSTGTIGESKKGRKEKK